eukprot:34844-Eustigmatos_ZCMA.PRE.1
MQVKQTMVEDQVPQELAQVLETYSDVTLPVEVFVEGVLRAVRDTPAVEWLINAKHRDQLRDLLT